MPLPNFSADDFATSLMARLPRGRAWPRDSDTVIKQVINALAPTAQRVTDRAAQLLQDAFPSQPYELLPEWEATLGLPDPCAGTSPSIEVRQAQVKARFAGTGGQSVSYFINFAATLGYAITIAQFTFCRCGMACGLPLYGTAWAFAWQVNGPVYTIVPARCGSAACGEPLASWPTDILQCELKRIAPAHTFVIFNFV